MSFYEPKRRMKSVSSVDHVGLTTGTVVENHDDEHPGMVKVELPIRAEGMGVTEWVQVATPYAGAGRGLYLHPEVGDTVVVGFLGGDDRAPVVLGTIWEAEVELPEGAVDKDNKFKRFRSREGSMITFTDESGKEQIETVTPGELSITLADEPQTITLKDSGGSNQMVINAKDGKLTLDAEKNITLTCGNCSIEMDGNGGTITIKADNVKINASSAAEFKGMTTDIKGSTTNVKADGNLTAQASGITTVKGSLVKING